jgi:hypothetical protein
MQSSLSYRHRVITEDDLVFIRKLIAEHPGSSRRDVSKRLCQAWNWVQANGALRDMVCRGLLLGLDRAGLIALPARRFCPPNPLAQRRPPSASLDRAWDPLQCTVNELGPVQIRQVRRTPQEELFGSLMEAHHYLAYTQPVGEHLKYLIWARGTPIACLAWSSAPRHLPRIHCGCRRGAPNQPAPDCITRVSDFTVGPVSHLPSHC